MANIFPGAVMLRSSASALFVLTALFSVAQNEDDALRFSSVAPGGTARSMGLANAFGALGADGGAIGINPAGLGLYRISEISLTPGFEVNTIKSGYHGTNASDTRARLFLGNFTLALHSPSQTGSNWRSSTFGMVYDRQATNHWRSQAQADRVGTSILNAFAFQGEGIPYFDLDSLAAFTTNLAWEAYGINSRISSTGDTLYDSYVAALPPGAQVGQSHTIDAHGATSNTSFFWSGNYQDRFYLGLSVGIIGHRYNRTTTHSETTVDEAIDLKDMRYQENLTTSGNGIDVKAGVIMRVTERFRTGLAFHSPMWAQLNDAYTSEVRTNFRSPDSEGRTSYTASSPDGYLNYRVQSPWRLVASAAYIAGDHGLFSVDYEYADYANARFKPSNKLNDPYDFATENETIKTSFRSVHSVRAGTEWRRGNWYFRLGWGFVPDAFVKDDARHGQALRTFAGGIGYRTDHLGVDLGLNYQERTTNYFQYDPTLASVTTEQRTSVRSLVTVSLRP